MIRERARAKVNLTLGVLGRRADGYHEIESLVAFAEAADEIGFDPGRPPGVTVSGPFGPSIVGDNIAATALARLAHAEPRLRLGHVHIEKHLPVAAGVGGGSANAAAVLRAVRAANPDLAGAFDWGAVARGLGADVPVCLVDRAVLMRGMGEQLEPVVLPSLPAVLVNPQVPVPADKTARVFRALAAQPLPVEAGSPADAVPRFASIPDVAQYMSCRGNDLADAAIQVLPALTKVLVALISETSSMAVTMSGAGPTCLALYATERQAAAAAATLQATHPDWWVRATTLG